MHVFAVIHVTDVNILDAIVGVIVCHPQDALGTAMDAQPIFVSVVDDLLFYESNEVCWYAYLLTSLMRLTG